MQTHYDKNFYHHHFDSPEDVMSTPIQVRRNQYHWDQYLKDHKHKSSSWWGAENAEQVQHLVHNGWPEGLQRIRDALNAIVPTRIRGLRKRKRRGAFGDEIDMQRVYSGNVDKAWTRTVREETVQSRAKKGGRKITILVQQNASWQVKADEMFWRGAVAAALTEILQANGYSVEIVAAAHTRQDGKDLFVSTTVKRFEHRMDMTQVAALTALAGFNRYFGFYGYCTAPFEINYAFGVPQSLPREIPMFENRGARVYIENVWSQQEAAALLQRISAQYISKEAA